MDELCITVMPAWLIRASSGAAGTWWSVELAWFTQFEAMSQSPPAALVQSMLASSVRSSIRSHAGQKAYSLPRAARRRMCLDLRSRGPDFLTSFINFAIIIGAPSSGPSQHEPQKAKPTCAHTHSLDRPEAPSSGKVLAKRSL